MIKPAGLSEQTAVVYYDLGRALEAPGACHQGLANVPALASWRLDYQDVAQRLKALADPAVAAQAAAQSPAPG